MRQPRLADRNFGGIATRRSFPLLPCRKWVVFHRYPGKVSFSFAPLQRLLRPLILVRIGARPILGDLVQIKKPCKCLTYRALSSEAEGARTLNLRIDSPNSPLVSAYEYSIYKAKIKGVLSNSCPTVVT